MRLITPHHVGLIQACYPATTTNGISNITPKSQELSRLVYYASNKPAKLQKLGKELVQRITSDSTKAAQGHGSTRHRCMLLVTIAILRALVTECRQELSILTPYALKALASCFSRISQDLEIVAHIAQVFILWCRHSDGSSIGVDEGITKDYLKALSNACSLCIARNSDSETKNRMRLLGLVQVSSVIDSESLYKSSSQFQIQVDLMLPALLANMSSELHLAGNGRATPVPYFENYRSELLGEIIPPWIYTHIDGEGGPTSEHVVETSATIFRALLQQSRASQVAQCLNAIFADSRLLHDMALSSQLIEITLEAVRYQYRFIIPTKLTAHLHALPDQTASDVQLSLSNMLHSVLSSNTPILNVSTSDILSQLLSLLLRRCAQEPKDISLDSIVACISVLGIHIYYTDQVPDLVQELVNKLISVQAYGPLGPGEPSTVETRGAALRLVLAALDGLMSTVPSRHSGFGPPTHSNAREESGNQPTRIHLRRPTIGPEIMQDSLSILYDKDYTVRDMYCSQLTRYIRTELPKDCATLGDAYDREKYQSSVGREGELVDLGNTTNRFLHAVHASVYKLATAKKAQDENDSKMELAPLKRATAEVAVREELNEDGAQFGPRRTFADVSPVPADYYNLVDLLVALQEHMPRRALLIGIPMVLALQRSVFCEQEYISIAVPQKRAISEVVGAALRKISLIWSCDELRRIVDETFQGTFLFLRDPSSQVVEIQSWPSQTEEPGFIDTGSVIAAISDCQSVQSLMGMDATSLREILVRPWSVEMLSQSSNERFKIGSSSPESSHVPLIKLSPQLMHIENLSLSSLARSARGAGAVDLREALERHNGRPIAAHRRPPIHNKTSYAGTNILDQNMGGESMASGNSTEVRELLEKIGVGRDPSNSLLKTPFPSSVT